MLTALLVSLLVIGAVVVVGVLGHLIDKTGEPVVEPKRQGKGA
jgi:hypothetical protein